jgi:trk system potassium uptake protein TrkA
MKRFAVIGLGKFGYHVARSLFEDGNEVIAVDLNRDRVQAMDKYSSQAVLLDATDTERLEALGLDEVDAVVVSTGDQISTSILICYHLKEIGVKSIVAKSLDDDHAVILKKVGASSTVHPERDMAARIARGLSRPNLMDYVPLEDEYDLVQIPPPKSFVGRSLKDLDLRAEYGVHVMAVKEADKAKFTLVPSSRYEIKENDLLVLLGYSEDLRKIREKG